VSLADRDKSDRNRHWAEYKRQYALGYHSNRKEAPACPTPSLPSGFTYFRPPLHPREAERRFALYRYRILKTTLPRFAFDHLTNLTQRLFNADACIVSLVDDEYQWFVSEIGLGCSSTTRGVSFCGHAILAPALEKNKPMVVLDAKKDWRFHDNPLVVAPPFIQFYAGAPLIDPDSGLPLGTLCILGLNQPWEEFTAADGKLLCDLADLVVRELRLWREERWAEVKNNMQKTVAEFTERTVAARSAPDEKEGFNMAVKMIRETLGADLVALVRCADSEEAETTSPEDCLALDAGETPALPQFYQQLPRGLAGEDPEPWPIEFLNQVVESSDGVVWQDDFMSFCNPYVPSVLRNLRGTGACSGTAVPVYRVLGERQYTVGGGENSSLHHAKPFAVLGAWWADGRRIVEDMDRRFLQNFAIGLTALAQRGRVELANRSKSSFVNSISHELRTPLHGILAVVELLEDTRLSPAQKQFLQTIESCGRSLVSVVNHVLDLAKIEYGRMEVLGQPVPVDLWSLCQEVCDAMAATVKPGISFGMRVKTGCNIAARWCVSDPGCLRQILLNLIGNALKFTVEGSVVLELHDVSCDEDVPPTQRMIRFRVVDTGPGMSPRFQEKLCQPFSQENPLTGGTGLGLAITRYLVQAMRGDFLVQSQLGRGSAFQVTVPVNSLSPEEMSHISVEHPTLDVDEMRHIIRNKRAAVISSAHLALDVADCLVEHFGVTIDAVDAHTLEATLQHIPYDFLFVEDDLEALRLAVRSPVKYVMGMWDIIGFEAASTCLEEANGQGIDTSTRILLAKPIGLARFLEGIWQLITSQPQDILATSKRVLLPTPPPSLPSADKTTRDYADNSTQTPEIVFVPMFRDAMELKCTPYYCL
jgi:signal transduction histidine kinase